MTREKKPQRALEELGGNPHRSLEAPLGIFSLVLALPEDLELPPASLSLGLQLLMRLLADSTTLTTLDSRHPDFALTGDDM